MIYEQFGIFHICTIICALALPFILYFSLKKLSNKKKKIILFSISLIGPVLLLIELFRTLNIIEHLPLHMCSINGFLLPIVCLTGNKRLGNMLLLWAIGAFCGIFFNFLVDDCYIYELRTWTYYLPHLTQFAIPLVLGKFRIIDYDVKTIPTTLFYTFLFYTGVHICNVEIRDYYLINKGQLVDVNYMFTLHHADNILLKTCWNILPYEYFYMFAITPLLLLIEVCIYGKQIFLFLKKKMLKK